MKKRAVCKGCQEPFEFESRVAKGIYCSNRCQHAYKNALFIESWKAGSGLTALSQPRSGPTSSKRLATSAPCAAGGR